MCSSPRLSLELDENVSGSSSSSVTLSGSPTHSEGDAALKSLKRKRSLETLQAVKVPSVQAPKPSTDTRKKNPEYFRKLEALKLVTDRIATCKDPRLRKELVSRELERCNPFLPSVRARPTAPAPAPHAHVHASPPRPHSLAPASLQLESRDIVGFTGIPSLGNMIIRPDEDSEGDD
ncbi:hypothetical protein FRC03_006526 [Tulasnella sp. 419]|nr:hypothetical protein FRC03_006526 [Tulasnella sp. 419]